MQSIRSTASISSKALRQTLKRSFATQRVVTDAMRESAAPAPSESVWSKLLGSSKMPRVPLSQPFPSAPAVESASITAPNPDAQITTLSNGLRVVTVDSYSPMASVSVMVDAGSRYEKFEESGISHFFETVALKSTKNRSEFRLVRDMLKLGANLSCVATRENVIYNVDVVKHQLPWVLGTLADLTQYPAFKEAELNEAREHYEAVVQERLKSPEAVLEDAIHQAAYASNTLGQPLYAPLKNLAKFNTEALNNYVSKFFTPSRMVISAVGVDHQELVNLTQELFVDLPASKNVTMDPARYTGGEVRLHNKDAEGFSHVAVAFETANWNSKDVIALTVLQTLMGGGSSFSAGGPGKGMYSRLYLNVLNKHGFIENATSFTSIFSDSGLFGIFGAAEAKELGNLVEVIAAEAKKMAGPITAEELNRAKAQTKSNLLMQLESRSLKAEDLAKQLLTYGKVNSPAQMAAQIDAVQAEDIQRVASQLLRTTPSVAASGDLTFLPRYEQISQAFKL